MNTTFRQLIAITVFSIVTVATAQQPVVENPDHESMLASNDPQLSANKRLVYDMWRVLLEAGQYDQAKKFLSKDYTDHNATIPPGRAAFVDYLKQRPQREVRDRVQTKIVTITAEHDRVIINFVRTLENPKKEGELYSTSGFDMYRIEDGLIAEHWDAIELGRKTTHVQ